MIEATEVLLTGAAVLAAGGAGFAAGLRRGRGRAKPRPADERATDAVAEVDVPDGPDEDEAAEARSLVSRHAAGLALADIAATADPALEVAEAPTVVIPESVTVPPLIAELLRPAEAVKALQEALPGGQVHVPADWPEARKAELGADPEARAELMAEVDAGPLARAEMVAEVLDRMADEPDEAPRSTPAMKPATRVLPIVRRTEPAPTPPAPAEAPAWVKWNDPAVLAATPPAEVAPEAPDCDPPEPGTFDAGHEPICAPMEVHYDLPEAAPAPAYDPPAPSYDPPSYDSGSSSSYDSGGGGGGYSGGE